MSAADDIYRELIAPIEERMTGVVARLVRDPEDAADTLQNTLAFIWKNLKRIHHHPNPHAYILRVCVSACYDTVRKRARQRQREVSIEQSGHVLVAAGGPPTSTLASAREQAILAAIVSLPRNQAQAVLLRVVEGESFETIARALGCKEATARSHVSKGKATLRHMLAEVL